MRTLGIVLLIVGVLVGVLGTLYVMASALNSLQPANSRQAMSFTAIGLAIDAVGLGLIVASVFRFPNGRQKTPN